MAESEQQPVLENVITSEQPAEETKIVEAPASDANPQPAESETKAGGSCKVENSSENQEKSKK